MTTSNKKAASTEAPAAGLTAEEEGRRDSDVKRPDANARQTGKALADTPEFVDGVTGERMSLEMLVKALRGDA